MTTTDGFQIENLMMIDDSDIDQMIYHRIVTRSGMVRNLIQFMDAVEALEYLSDAANPKPDLILLDINMPRMDGFEFLEAATDRFAQDLCPIVVMLTTSLNPKDEERAKSFSIVHDFLNKPLTKQQLQKLGQMLSAAQAKTA